jgi:hypothetical protein
VSKCGTMELRVYVGHLGHVTVILVLHRVPFPEKTRRFVCAFFLLISNLLVTRIKILYAMDDGFHSFVCGDCWNLGDYACIEWGENCSVLPNLILILIKSRIIF